MKLNNKQLTVAIARYARKHGYYTRTVRVVTTLFNSAILEYKESING